MFDRLETSTFLYPDGALAACRGIARLLEQDRQKVRDHVVIRTTVRGMSLKNVVDERFEAFWGGEAAEETTEGSVQ